MSAEKQRKTFSMQCGVTIDIAAPPEKIWALLTDAAGFPTWNSTVTSIEGRIALGEKIKLKVPISTRVFSLKVTELEANKRMVWADGFAPMFRGVRTYTLTPTSDGKTGFSMVEVFSGLMLPMIAGSLPDFAPSFEQYAADLKKAAERT
jgi:uncharacterized protein YndB with AHSA1/START domain